MKFQRIFAALLILVMVCSFASLSSAKETLIRDSWAILEQEGNPVGFGYNQLRQSDIGYLYITDITMQISMLGAPSKITEHVELTVDKQYLARSVSVTIDANGSKTLYKTDFTKNEIKMVITSSDGKETTSVFNPGKPVYFQESFLDSLIAAKKITPGREYGALIWDLATMTPTDCKIKINAKKTYSYGDKTIPVFEIQATTGAYSSTSLIDAKGDTYWEEDPQQKLILHKVEKNQIPELQAMNMEVLLVPGNILVPRPFKSESSKIKVTWKDLKFADFKFDDNRQKLVKHIENEAGHEVTLTIQKEQRDFTGKVVLPVSDPKFSLFLAESPYISPGLPEVQKIKEEILDGETDGWVATQKILSWVFTYIQPELIPQTLSTEEILTQKRGKCVEYAILFAALSRAAGLPTRMSLGERYQDGAWVGHMWNEVWLGEWIAVDASHNQVAPDALLLKLVDSETIMGTQKVRTGLIGQLGIRIEDVKVPQDEAPSTTVIKTGIVDNVYTNAQFRLRIQVPAGWKMIETKEQGTPLLVMQSLNDPSCTAILVLSSIPSGTTAEQILKSRIQLTQALVEEFTLIRQDQGPLGKRTSGETTLGLPGSSEDPSSQSSPGEGGPIIGGADQGIPSENDPGQGGPSEGGAGEDPSGQGSPVQGGPSEGSTDQGGPSEGGAGQSPSGPNAACGVTFATWSFNFQGSKTCQENWVLIQNDFLYLLVFSTPEAQWEAYQAQFQEIRDGFQIM